MARIIRSFLLLLSLFVFCHAARAAQFGDLKDLAQIKPAVISKRISSYDRSGGNRDALRIPSGSTAEIFKAEGAGVITHIWVTIDHRDELSRRNLILRMYWDGETEPSVQAPIGDFFGQGWGEFYEYVTPVLSSGPHEGRAMVSYLPMPFARGARITLENDSETDVASFYYYVDYEEHAKLDQDVGRFHAWWNHQLTEAPPEGENEWGSLGGTGQEHYRRTQLPVHGDNRGRPVRGRELLRHHAHSDVVRRGR
ncbi:MAG: DUF2961 domain-containing protein [Candidatus Glassbacteria bacterium]